MKPIQIVITPAVARPDEAQRITTILDAGWDAVNIRLPGASLKDVKNLIEAVPQKFHGRLWLHGHFELVNEFNLGGLQLNSRCPVPPRNYSGPIGRSCHTVEEVLDYGQDSRFSRLTLSPIFDSVSKEGYKGKFSDYELLEIADLLVPVIALGGVTPSRLELLNKYPFSGYAVLGYLQKAENLDDLKKKLSEFENN